MSLHDAYARVTPFELAFRDVESAEALSAEVTQESAGRGADAAHPHAFVTMEAVERFSRELAGDGAPESASLRYGPLAYHGVHFVRGGCPLYLLSAHVARYLVGGVPGPAAAPPTNAGYLQLPQHLFWADGEAGAPESVDGLFWSAPDGETLHTLLATGVRPRGEGLGVVPLPAAPLTDASAWLDVDARGDGRDFVNEMPGSDLEGLLSFETAGEVLKLLARFFAFVAAVPDALVEAPRPASRPESLGDAPGPHPGPEPSNLACTRVILNA